jgi:hypothetical protein
MDKPSANIIGIFTLGFHNQHVCQELKRMLQDLDIETICKNLILRPKNKRGQWM